jgi:hypothetical protein
MMSDREITWDWHSRPERDLSPVDGVGEAVNFF